MSAWTEPLPGGGYRGRYTDQHGKKQTVTPPDGVRFSRKTDAKLAAQEAEAKARRRAAVAAGNAPGNILWGKWWATIVDDRTFPATDTARTERLIVENFLLPKWGDTPLNELKFSEIQDWVDTTLKVGPGMSPGYVSKIFSIFRVSIKIALKKSVLDASPCAGIVLPTVHKKPKTYLSVKAADAMSEHLRDDYNDAISFGLETGLRPGELCGLHEDRIDFDRGWMLVAEVLVERSMQIRPFPKDGDVRMIPLTDLAMEIADRRLTGRYRFGGCGLPHTDGISCDGAIVFLTDWHRIMRPNTLTWNMRKSSRLAEIGRRTSYTIRRGWATRAAEGGLDAFAIARILGHSTLEEAQGYVQETSRARLSLQDALSQVPQLPRERPLRGAARGVNGHNQALTDTSIGGSGNLPPPAKTRPATTKTNQSHQTAKPQVRNTKPPASGTNDVAT